ncbi:MAG: hypothetical protein J6A45_04990 [Lachnospiraceae bacterium]|nr:hypothetical protein [Lachnospiraceae bacterium]
MEIIKKISKGVLVTATLMVLYIICFGMGNRISTILALGWSIAVGTIFSCFPKTLSISEQTQDKILKIMNVVVVVACTCMSLLLCITQSITYDEAYTIGMINRSYVDVVEITANDVHSPLYYFVLKFFCGELDNLQIYAAKLFSAIFFVGHLTVGGLFCRKIYNRKVEFYWLVLNGFMPAMVIQAASVRMYSMGLFFFTLTAFLAYRIYQEETKKRWIEFTLASILTMYIHTFTMIEVFVLYLLMFALLVNKKRYRSLRAFFASGVIAGVAYVPWLGVLWHQMRRWIGVEEGWSNTIEELTFHNSDKFLAEWFSSLENPQSLAILFGVALLIYVLYYVRRYTNDTKDFVPYVGMIIAGVVVAAAVIVSISIVPCFLGRYIFPVFGLIWLYVAVGVVEVKEYWKKGVIVVCILLCGASAFRMEWRLDRDEGISEYIAFMEENFDEDDVIMADIFTDAMMTIYSPEGRYMIYGYKPPCLPFDNLEVFQQWDQLDGVDTIWYIERREGMVHQLDEKYQSEIALRFSFSHYNFIVQKATRKE